MLADYLEEALSKFGHSSEEFEADLFWQEIPVGKPMPYRTKIDLPASVRDHLPPHAQDIFAPRSIMFAAHAGDVRQEEIAHRTAWAAVKRSYVKNGDRWVPIE
jgi:cation transport regulator